MSKHDDNGDCEALESPEEKRRRIDRHWREKMNRAADTLAPDFKPVTFDEAKECLRKAFTRAPKHGKARYDIARLYVRLAALRADAMAVARVAPSIDWK